MNARREYRNKKIREFFKKEIEKKHSAEKIIDELAQQYCLEWDTIRQIVYDKKYGKRGNAKSNL